VQVDKVGVAKNGRFKVDGAEVLVGYSDPAAEKAYYSFFSIDEVKYHVALEIALDQHGSPTSVYTLSGLDLPLSADQSTILKKLLQKSIADPRRLQRDRVMVNLVTIHWVLSPPPKRCRAVV
jgi:hypothetical protein